MALMLKALSSLHKVYPEEVPQATYTGGTVLQNEPFSFQIAYKMTEGRCPVYVQIDAGDLPVNHYRVDYLPILAPNIPGSDGLGDRTVPGMYPDVLRPRVTNPEVRDESVWSSRWYEVGEKNPIYALSESWQALWFTVNEDGKETLPAGEYPITVRLHSQMDCSVLAEETVTLTVLGTTLAPQTLLYTNWFHADCLADLHRVDMFGDEFFEILESYAHMAIRNGMNMMLLPAFTPPLDTPVGCERATAQLVGVTVTDGIYSFDLTLLKRYVDVCRRAGITHFEHSHFFSQWGAKAAPKVMATVGGEYKRIFGWDTPATGEYASFLRAYIPVLRQFLKQEGLDDKVMFHISDEPRDDMAPDYAAARDSIKDLLEGCMLGDALSHYELYEQGLVDIPIVCTHSIAPFLGNCEDLWCYYTGGQVKNGLSNRLISQCSPRNRVIGMQMYRYAIKGFLHWGYNYYYGCMSHGVGDVSSTPGLYEMTNGSPYVVYPGFDGTCLQSIRLKVFGEGVCDMRALQTLEALTDRQTVCDLLDSFFEGGLTFNSCPVEPETFIAIRRAINEAIATHI